MVYKTRKKVQFSNVDFMNKYFKTEDLIVCIVSILCLVWIILYRVYWVDIEPIFRNADRWSEITYTIFSSVVAAGLFYLVTIFIPRYAQIKKMIKYILFDLQDTNGLFKEIIDDINRGESQRKYNLDDFPLTSRYENFTEARTDFVNHFISTQKFKELEITLTTSKRYFEIVYSTYSIFLPLDIKALLNNFIHMNYKENKEIYETTNYEESKEALEHYFSTFVLGLIISKELEKQYKIKL